MNKATLTLPSDREMRIERIFPATLDRVWRAMTEAALLAQWWGRGHEMVVEKFEFVRGGHWRFVEHAPHGSFGFEGRFREIQPKTHMSQTFEWDGAPGHVTVQDLTLEDLGDGRTKMVATSTFFTKEDRDAMMNSGMEGGMNESYAALDRILATL